MSVALSNAKRWQKTDLSPIACSASGVQSVASFPLNMATGKQAIGGRGHIVLRLKSVAEHVNWTNLSTLSCPASDCSHTLPSERPLKIVEKDVPHFRVIVSPPRQVFAKKSLIFWNFTKKVFLFPLPVDRAWSISEFSIGPNLSRYFAPITGRAPACL